MGKKERLENDDGCTRSFSTPIPITRVKIDYLVLHVAGLFPWLFYALSTPKGCKFHFARNGNF